MHTFDYCCALCCGPFTPQIKLGSSQPDALNERRRRVKLVHRRLRGEPVHEDSFTRLNQDGLVDVYFNGDWCSVRPRDHKRRSWEMDTPLARTYAEVEKMSESSAANAAQIQPMPIDFPASISYNHRTFDAVNIAANEEFKMSSDEQKSYDPTFVDGFRWISSIHVLERKDLTWLPDDIERNPTYNEGFLAYNTKAADERRRRTIPTVVMLERERPYSGIRYQPKNGKFPKHPIHAACFDILTRHLGYFSWDEVNMNTLYAVLSQFAGDALRLELDYGTLDCASATWVCYEGREHEVADPRKQENILPVIQNMIPTRLFGSQKSTTLALSSKVKFDPFSKLPYDVLHIIFENTYVEDTISLLNASWHVFHSAQHGAFWKKMIRVQIASFFYELEHLLNDLENSDDFDWRGMFLWLNYITDWKNAMGNPLAGVANRRRIWNVCAQLSPHYFKKLKLPNKFYEEPSDDEAAAIMDIAEAYDNSITCWPQSDFEADCMPRTSVQFVRSWNELSSGPCELHTYWALPRRQPCHLRGVSLTFGGMERLFGTKTMYRCSTTILSDDWICGLVLIMYDIRPKANRRSLQLQKTDPTTMHKLEVAGLRIHTGKGSGGSHVGDVRCSERALIALPGLTIVGLTGKIAKNGDILELGLLQARRPDEMISVPVLQYDRTALITWTPRAARFLSKLSFLDGPDKGRYKHCPLLTNPLNLADGTEKPKIPAECLRHDCLLIPTANLATLHGIRTFEYDGRVLGIHLSIFPLWAPPRQGKYSISEVLDTSGVGMSGAYEAGIIKEQLITNTFNFDGKSGERITEVHFNTDKSSFRLATNKGRLGTFGAWNDETQWQVFMPEAGYYIAGLTTCFGNLEGWNGKMYQWTCTSLSELGVVITRDTAAE